MNSSDIHDLVMETAKALIYSGVGLLFAVSTASIGVLFKMFLDVKSLKKGQTSGFEKVRALEKKVFGEITSELDDKGRSRR